MAQVIKAPSSLKNGFRVFLSGSVEGKDWRAALMKKLKSQDIIFLDPRRDDWDSSWKKSKTDPKFSKQVNWELHGLEKADVIALYFDKASESPISLLEFGLFGRSGKMIVYCSKGFAHKGNVDIVCERYKIEQVDSMDKLAKSIISKYSKTGKKEK